MDIRKGIIQAYTYKNQFDDNGIEYRIFTLTIDEKKYTSRAPKNLYLTEGATIIFECSGTEITAAFCPIQGTSWGKNSGKLKRQTAATDRYAFVQGIVLEKRKETVSSADFSKDLQQQHRGVGFTVVLKDETRFNAAWQFGHPLKPDMEIAVVLEQNSAVLLLDKKRNKLYGRQKPYFILFALLLIAFTPGLYYLQKIKPDMLVNFNVTLVVINIFLGLALLLSIVTFIKGQSAKKFLYAELSQQRQDAQDIS